MPVSYTHLEELDEISRKIKQLEIEREAIKRENDKPKLEQIGKELAELKEQEKSYKAKWQNEKTLVNKIQQNKVEIENLKFEADKATTHTAKMSIPISP